MALARHVATVHKSLKAPKDDRMNIDIDVMRAYIAKA